MGLRFWNEKNFLGSLGQSMFVHQDGLALHLIYKYEKVTPSSRSATLKYESTKEVTQYECRDDILSHIYINKYRTHHFICMVEKFYYLLIIYKTYLHYTQFWRNQ